VPRRGILIRVRTPISRLGEEQIIRRGLEGPPGLVQRVIREGGAPAPPAQRGRLVCGGAREAGGGLRTLSKLRGLAAGHGSATGGSWGWGRTPGGSRVVRHMGGEKSMTMKGASFRRGCSWGCFGQAAASAALGPSSICSTDNYRSYVSKHPLGRFDRLGDLRHCSLLSMVAECMYDTDSYKN
jgi:hypothetical protein